MKTFKQILLTTIFSLLATSVTAAPINILDLPTETTGPFRHNVFHDASTNGGAGGSIFSWFTLDNGTWDPVTGDLVLAVDLWDDSAHTIAEGTATATGSFDISQFNGHDGGPILGTITWDFTNATDAGLFGNIVLTFLDYNYVTSTNGHTANSYTGEYLTLWGADGTFLTVDDPTDPAKKAGTFWEAKVGMDMVAHVVPVPAAVWLFGSGLLGLVAIARRRAV